MKVMRKPFKNRDLAVEADYLGRMMAKGFKLQKQGLGFYFFSRAACGKSSIVVDLVPKAFTKEALEVEGWELLAIEPLVFSAFKKVYYVGEGEFVTDDLSRLAYYKSRMVMASVVFCLSLLIFLTTIGQIVTLPPMFYLFLPVIFFMSARRSLFDDKLVAQYNAQTGSGEMEWVAIGMKHYVIAIKDLPASRGEETAEMLKALGRVTAKSKEIFLLSSMLGPEEVRQEIVGMTGLSAEKIEVDYLFRGLNPMGYLF